MPKKRKTRAAPSRKAAPKIGEPTNDEAKQDKDDRAEAIAIYKEEFEQELKVREKKLEKELKDLTKSLKAAHRTTLISLPSFIQKMTVNEFVAYGGTVDTAAKAHVENSVSTQILPITKTTSSPSESGSTGEPLSEVTNRQMPAPPATTDSVSLAMETPMDTARSRAKRKHTVAETETLPRTTRRTTKKPLVDIGDTPAPTAPTPAFDCRLPGLKQGAGRTRAKTAKTTKRDVTITVNPDSRDDLLSMLNVVTECIPDTVDDDDAMIQKCKDLQARLTVALGQHKA